MMSLAPVFASLGRAGKKKTLQIHKKSRFQPNEKNFAKSCSVRYKDLLRAKKFLGVIGTLSSLVTCVGKIKSLNLCDTTVCYF